ncbi:hypothetical protein PIB30_083684 [Stylosanthes scabra]|uniref:Uncharacterized protein n=1 Tax=Stylosanthes scabra TaxID=79078 RepID=A0ABU6ZR49_9FABA|nr:hypothetical protein [Stylosanthes scabra]
MKTIAEDNLDDPRESNLQWSDMNTSEMGLLEGFLDVGMEEVDPLDPEAANGANNTLSGAQNKVSNTLSEVLEMEFDSLEAAVRFYLSPRLVDANYRL